MNGKRNLRERMTWGFVGAAMIFISAISLAVPTAAAQSTDQKSADTRQYFQVFENVYQFILKNYVDEVDAKELYQGAMKGMFEALGDPYSVFLDDAMMSDMTDVTEGVFGGIGLYISKQIPDPSLPEDVPRFIEVVSPIEDTPGWRAGFKPGDLIVEINGESTAPLSTDEAQAKIRGEAGSEVSFKIRRGEKLEFALTVKRAIIEIPTVRKALIPTGKGSVAYLRIIDFTPQTFPRVQEALKEFDDSGYRAMIVDVRSNPGGLLQSVIQIADLFLDRGVIVSTKGRSPFENSVNRAKPDLGVPADKPVIVLINRGSASASEILAGALKDNKRALLIGEKSYGKGSVQQVFPLDGNGFKLTMARYYTPSDWNIDKTGIMPDIEAKEPDISDAEAAEIERLFTSGRITAFVKEKPQATTAEREEFAQSLVAEGYGLPVRLLSRLVKDELSRTSIAPTYDLEFDVALVKALDTIDRPDYSSLLAEAKTIKELAAASDSTASVGSAGTSDPAK